MAVTKKFLKTKPEVQVTFEVKVDTTESASQVYVVGEFADWEPVELKKLKNGAFKTTINLPTNQQDSYQYRYRFVLADGSEKFDNEVQADGYCSNPFGGENSIISVTQQ
ncbi:isoamylase early set domain-containing protein [uncultured Tolumonas sp.]|jgi:Starch binding domain.|uniref:isoamylase early set domain-containing protein n=1 Tax=uncultured Tolumonas sp. TaxID=263765 RepID=UPI00292DA59B|nr:isoamylase early set domain-containing protein [uncultured Tolumonas sp.]